MSKKLIVWGGSKQGMYREIVATKTQKKAIELFGISYSHFKNFYCETGNEKEIKIAISKPNTVFRTTDNQSDNYFEDIKC